MLSPAESRLVSKCDNANDFTHQASKVASSLVIVAGLSVFNRLFL